MPALRTTARIAWYGAIAVMLYFTWIAVEAQITWYLAVDQFGYLKFAGDLLHGRIFHEWRPLEALAPFMPDRTDLMAQTYVFEDGRLHCRYAPGFPILLAAWMGLFGADGANYLNATVFLTLLCVLVVFQWRIFGSRWRAGAGALLLLLFPSLTHLWALTLTRDLAAHLFAFFGLLLMLPHRTARLASWRTLLAGVALGYAATIRPDAVLYLVPAAGLALFRWWREGHAVVPLGRATAIAVVGMLLGLSPFFAYNTIVHRNPFHATQSMELNRFLPSWNVPQPEPADGTRIGYPSPGWHGGIATQVQGGGLRLNNLKKTLPGNLQLVRAVYSPLLLALAGWGAVVAILMRRTLAVTAVSYVVIALLFYSCWPRPDHRYLIGVWSFMPMLIVEGTLGTLDLIRLLWRQRWVDVSRGLALTVGIVLIGAVIVMDAPANNPSTALLFQLLPLTAAVASLATLALPGRRIAAVVSPLLMIVLLFTWVNRVEANRDRRAPFQGPEMYQARANLARFVEPGSLVITTEDVGRPAENIEYYSGVADAIYMTEVRRWRTSVPTVAGAVLAKGIRPYLYLPSDDRELPSILAELERRGFETELVADVPAGRALQHFVAAPFHRGVRMQLYRLSHEAMEASAGAERD
jgi:4-amino-4-deoxy-L-arabinose transferase-like glycosyltransferase